MRRVGHEAGLLFVSVAHAFDHLVDRAFQAFQLCVSRGQDLPFVRRAQAVDSRFELGEAVVHTNVHVAQIHGCLRDLVQGLQLRSDAQQVQHELYEDHDAFDLQQQEEAPARDDLPTDREDGTGKFFAVRIQRRVERDLRPRLNPEHDEVHDDERQQQIQGGPQRNAQRDGARPYPFIPCSGFLFIHVRRGSRSRRRARSG